MFFTEKNAFKALVEQGIFFAVYFGILLSPLRQQPRHDVDRLLELSCRDQFFYFGGAIFCHAEELGAVGVRLVSAAAVFGAVDVGVVVGDGGGGGNRDQVLPLVAGVAGLLLELAPGRFEGVFAAGHRLSLRDVFLAVPALDSAGHELGRHFAQAVPVLAHADIVAVLVGCDDHHVAAAAEIVVRGERGAVREAVLHLPEIDPLVLNDMFDADGLPFEVVVGIAVFFIVHLSAFLIDVLMPSKS